MVLGVDDAAKEFGKSMGGKAAVALCEWFQRLWDAEGVAKKKQLENIVEPAFKKFQEIYDEYEQSFKEYRAKLIDADSKQHIQRVVDQIEGDLRFTAKNRVDLLGQLKHPSNSIFSGFVTSIVQFLVSNEESLSGSPEDSLAPPEIASQVMRRGLIADLRAVMAPWAAALDPGASAPPLLGDELESTLDDLALRYGIAENDPKREGKLRARLAVDRLDSRLDSMIAAYKIVREEYEKLKSSLSTS